MCGSLFKNNFALICSESYLILIDTISNRMFKITDGNLINQYLDYFDRDIESPSVSNKLLEIGSERKNNEYNCAQEMKIKASEFQINKLVIVLTSKCNLRCKYCYANYGLYCFEDDSDMTEETLITSLDYFTNNFKGISNILFFGGEPTLKEELIIKTINYFNDKNHFRPSYGMVTNAMAISDRLIDVISKENFNLTISIDGEQTINDMLRVNYNGDGSFTNISKNFNKMNEKGIRIGVEVTYTSFHIRNNVSFVDLIKYFGSNFNCLIPHIVPVDIESDHELSLQSHTYKLIEYIDELVDYTFDNILSGNPIQTIAIMCGIINKMMKNKNQSTICPAGLKTFSIAKDQKILPCFLYTSNDDISYGRIGDDPQLILEKAKTFDYDINRKEVSSNCQSCFAKGVCSSCLGSFNIENSIPIVNNEIICIFIKRIVEKSYIKINEIYGDEKLKESFNKIMFTSSN